jgi:hypothetical protein
MTTTLRPSCVPAADHSLPGTGSAPRRAKARRDSCRTAQAPINLDAPTLLPLVAATRWKKVRVGSVRDVIVERWTIDDLDFLELSIRSDTVADAPAAQQ